MGRARNWTKAEEEWLAEAWGKLSTGTIARKLNRSVDGIKVRAQRMGLGPWLMGGDFVSLNQLAKAMGFEKFSMYMARSWIDNRGMPVHKKLINCRRCRVVYIEEFWKWAKENRSFIDFSRMEPLALGREPDWVPEQRKNDHKSFALQRKDRWTKDDDLLLISLLEAQRYTRAEISRIMRRSDGAVARRIQTLGVRARPVMADPHSVWTDDDVRILEDGIKNGAGYGLISQAVGKSEKAVRAYVYRIYRTEQADAVRAMLGGGRFGDGAPEERKEA